MSSQPISTPIPHSPSPAKSHAARYFYSVAGIIMFICAVIGFRDFYLRGGAYPHRPLTPPIKFTVITHGVSMTLWIILIVVQPLLIASRRHRVHFTLGKIGAVLAILIVIVGIYTGTWSARVAPPEFTLWGLDAKGFMMIPYSAAIFFATFVAIGVWMRKRPETHRPMMLMATIATLPAPLDRIDLYRGLYDHSIFGSTLGPYAGGLFIGVALLAVKCALTRSFDRWFALGLAALTIAAAAAYQFAFTSAWRAIADMIV